MLRRARGEINVKLGVRLEQFTNISRKAVHLAHSSSAVGTFPLCHLLGIIESCPVHGHWTSLSRISLV